MAAPQCARDCKGWAAERPSRKVTETRSSVCLSSCLVCAPVCFSRWHSRCCRKSWQPVRLALARKLRPAVMATSLFARIWSTAASLPRLPHTCPPSAPRLTREYSFPAWLAGARRGGGPGGEGGAKQVFACVCVRWLGCPDPWRRFSSVVSHCPPSNQSTHQFALPVRPRYVIAKLTCAFHVQNIMSRCAAGPTCTQT